MTTAITEPITADTIRAKLATNNRWLIRGILAIYARQTADEKSLGHTRHHNKVGFNAPDANLLSSFAKQIKQWERGESRHHTPLSPRQIEIARRKMLKYSTQLASIAAEA